MLNPAQAAELVSIPAIASLLSGVGRNLNLFSPAGVIANFTFFSPPSRQKHTLNPSQSQSRGS